MIKEVLGLELWASLIKIFLLILLGILLLIKILSCQLLSKPNIILTTPFGLLLILLSNQFIGVTTHPGKYRTIT
jgi:hypothetical protein